MMLREVGRVGHMEWYLMGKIKKKSSSFGHIKFKLITGASIRRCQKESPRCGFGQMGEKSRTE